MFVCVESRFHDFLSLDSSIFFVYLFDYTDRIRTRPHSFLSSPERLNRNIIVFFFLIDWCVKLVIYSIEIFKINRPGKWSMKADSIWIWTPLNFIWEKERQESILGKFDARETTRKRKDENLFRIVRCRKHSGKNTQTRTLKTPKHSVWIQFSWEIWSTEFWRKLLLTSNKP